jgi:hypothetical protein
MISSGLRESRVHGQCTTAHPQRQGVQKTRRCDHWGQVHGFPDRVVDHSRIATLWFQQILQVVNVVGEFVQVG